MENKKAVKQLHGCMSRILLLPAHGLVGELSHSVELLLHLVFFSALPPGGAASPHNISH